MVKITLENGTKINFPMAESELREVLKTKEKRVIEVLETEIALIKEIIDTKYDYFEELTLNDGQILDLNNWILKFKEEILNYFELNVINALVEGGIIKEYMEINSIEKLGDIDELLHILDNLSFYKITRSDSLSATIESDIGYSMIKDYNYYEIPSEIERFIDYSKIGRDLLESDYEFLKNDNLLVRLY